MGDTPKLRQGVSLVSKHSINSFLAWDLTPVLCSLRKRGDENVGTDGMFPKRPLLLHGWVRPTLPQPGLADRLVSASDFQYFSFHGSQTWASSAASSSASRLETATVSKRLLQSENPDRDAMFPQRQAKSRRAARASTWRLNGRDSSLVSKPASNCLTKRVHPI